MRYSGRKRSIRGGGDNTGVREYVFGEQINRQGTDGQVYRRATQRMSPSGLA